MNNSRSSLCFIFCWLMIVCPALKADDQKSDKAQAAQASPDLSEESEQEVLSFVQQHHPELSKLMSFLKKKQPSNYKQAMRESRKVRDRLTQLKDRDSELYEVELAIWQNSADIRLLAAEVSAKSQTLGDEDRQRLKVLIERENELSIKRLTLEKARTEARLNQISQQLNRRQEQSETVITKGLKTWENRIQRSTTKPKKN